MWWILVQGCMVVVKLPEGGDDTDLPVVDTDPTEVPGPDDTDTAPVDPFADAARVRAFLEEGGDLAGLLHDIAWSGGWPVPTPEGTRIFLAEGDASWSLAGDFNGWAPAPMTRAAGYAWAEVEIGSPWDVGYKLVTDAGTPQESWLADPWARSYRYDAFGRISFVAPGSDTPHLERWPGLAGRGLLPRDVDVWVPAGPGPWPVLVMHDGRNLFDPEAMWGGWRLGDTLVGAPGPVLVVGLDNTPDRISEYTHAADVIDGLGAIEPKGAAYGELVALDVVPWVERTWETTGEVGVMGSSLGGLISLYIGLEHPDVFDFAGSLSGTLGWGRFGASNPTVGDLYADAGHLGITLYVDSGGEPGGSGCVDPDGDGWSEDDPDSTDNYCENAQLVDQLLAQGWAADVDLRYAWDPGAPHNEAAWASRVAEPIAFFLDRESPAP